METNDKRCPQGLVLGPVLFYISAVGMDSGTEGTFSRFAGDRELCGAVRCCKEGMEHPQGPADVGLCQTHGVQQGQVQGPAMGWDNPKHKHGLAKEWMEISHPWREGFGNLMDEKFDVTQPHELAASLAVPIAGLPWEAW